MKLISFNVNGIRAAEKKGVMKDLFVLGYDIICIQETKAEPSQLSKDLTSPASYHAYFDSSKVRKGYSGVALYSKVEPKKVEYGLGAEEMDHEGRMIVAHYDTYVVVTCYFPNGGRDEEHFQFKLRYYDLFLKKMKALEKKYEKVIFCGDLNVAHNEIDIARPKENANQIGFLPVERAWVDRVEEAGFIDTFRDLHKETVKYSWWDQKSGDRARNVGWRIDYFFVSASLKSSYSHADILDDVLGSDHAPIVLTCKV
jgi:exodeoxyribonuclease-3